MKKTRFHIIASSICILFLFFWYFFVYENISKDILQRRNKILKTAEIVILHSLYSKWGLAHELALYKEKAMYLDTVLIENQVLKKENELLKNNGEVSSNTNTKNIRARIISNVFDSTNGFFEIDQAPNDFFEKKVYAEFSDILLGYIIQKTKRNTFVVKPISAPDVFTDVYIAMKKDEALVQDLEYQTYKTVAKGRGEAMLYAKVPLGIPIEKGALVTTHLGDIVGTIADIKTGTHNEQEVRIRIPINIAHSTFVRL